jgi:hypothetical protein
VHASQLKEMLAIGVARHGRPVRLLGVGVRVTQDDFLSQLALFDSRDAEPSVHP